MHTLINWIKAVALFVILSSMFTGLAVLDISAQPVPQLEVSPATLTFDNVPAGGTLTVTLTNLAARNVTIFAVTLETLNPAVLTLVNGLVPPVTLLPGEVITQDVQYQPAANEAANGLLRITHDAKNTQEIVIPIGDGNVMPQLSLNPTNIDFGDVETGSTQSRTLSMSNLGTIPLTVTSLSVPDSDFSLESDAPATPFNIIPQGMISFGIAFSPVNVGVVNGSLIIDSNDPNRLMVVVDLRGNGTALPVPRIRVEPASLNFGEVDINSSADSELPLTIHNDGTADLTVDVNVSGDAFFWADSRSLSPIAAGTSDSITIAFSPSDVGFFDGMATIDSNDPSRPTVTVDLRGAGTAVPVPHISVDPTVLDFGEVEVDGFESATFDIANIGNADLTISAINIDGDAFDLSSGVSTPFAIAAGASEPIDIFFEPSSTGLITGTATIQSNDDSRPQVIVDLRGTGTAEPQIRVDPNALDFGDVDISSFDERDLVIHNDGTAELTINDIDVSGDDFFWSDSRSLPFSIAAGDSDSITIQFDPINEGGSSGTVTIESNDNSPSEVMVDLTGNGVSTAAPQISVSATGLSIQGVFSGPGSTTFSPIEISNDGNADLTIDGLSFSGDPVFSLDNAPDLPLVIAPGGSTTLTIVFTYSSAGTFTGSLDIESNDDDNTPVNISLLGSLL